MHQDAQMHDQLPPDLEHVRTTAVFDHENHPAGLRREHGVAEVVWARLVVHTGALHFVFDDDPDAPDAWRGEARWSSRPDGPTTWSCPSR